MGIGGFGQRQQRLQQTLDMTGAKQVFAARHQGYALQMVIDRYRQVIRGRRVAPGDDRVAFQFGLNTSAERMVSVPSRQASL